MSTDQKEPLEWLRRFVDSDKNIYRINSVGALVDAATGGPAKFTRFRESLVASGDILEISPADPSSVPWWQRRWIQPRNSKNEWRLADEKSGRMQTRKLGVGEELNLSEWFSACIDIEDANNGSLTETWPDESDTRGASEVAEPATVSEVKCENCIALQHQLAAAEKELGEARQESNMSLNTAEEAVRSLQDATKEKAAAHAELARLRKLERDIVQEMKSLPDSKCLWWFRVSAAAPWQLVRVKFYCSKKLRKPMWAPIEHDVYETESPPGAEWLELRSPLVLSDASAPPPVDNTERRFRGTGAIIPGSKCAHTWKGRDYRINHAGDVEFASCDREGIWIASDIGQFSESMLTGPNPPLIETTEWRDGK